MQLVAARRHEYVTKFDRVQFSDLQWWRSKKKKEPKQNIMVFNAYAWSANMTVNIYNVTHTKTNADVVQYRPVHR